MAAGKGGDEDFHNICDPGPSDGQRPPRRSVAGNAQARDPDSSADGRYGNPLDKERRVDSGSEAPPPAPPRLSVDAALARAAEEGDAGDEEEDSYDGGSDDTLQDTIMLAELTPDEEQGFTRFFNRLDRTMDGSLPAHELTAACNLLELRMTASQIKKLASRVCASPEQIQADEFLMFMSVVKTAVPASIWATASGRKLNYVVTKVLRDRDRHDIVQVDRRRQLIEESTSRPLSGILFRSCVEATRQMLALYWGVFVPLFFAATTYHYDHRGGHAMMTAEILGTVVAGFDFLWSLRFNGFQLRFMTVADICALQPLDFLGYCTDVKWLYRLGHGIRYLAVVKLLRAEQFRPGMGGQLVTIASVRFGLWVLPVLKQSVFAVLIIHLLACTFVACTCSGDTCDVPSRELYLEGTYWVLYSISSVGYGDVDVTLTSQAKMLALCLCIMSVFVNGWLVGKVASFLLLDPDAEHRLLLSRTMQVITSYHVPEDVVEDILSLQNHLLEQKLVLRSFLEVVNTLPPEVQEVLSLYVRVEFLGQIPLFANASAMCKVALAEVLCRRIVPRGEDIIVEEEAGYCMYVIVHGFAEVYINRKDLHLATLTKGAAFGEMALLAEENTRAASVRSLALCEILSLSRRDFDVISGRFPALRWQIEVIMAKRKGVPPPPFAAVLSRFGRKSVRSPSMAAPVRAGQVHEAIGIHLMKKHAEEQGRADDDLALSGTEASVGNWRSSSPILDVPLDSPSTRNWAVLREVSKRVTNLAKRKTERKEGCEKKECGEKKDLAATTKSVSPPRLDSPKPQGTSFRKSGSFASPAGADPSTKAILERLDHLTTQNEIMEKRMHDMHRGMLAGMRMLNRRMKEAMDKNTAGHITTIGFSRRDQFGERRELRKADMGRLSTDHPTPEGGKHHRRRNSASCRNLSPPREAKGRSYSDGSCRFSLHSSLAAE